MNVATAQQELIRAQSASGDNHSASGYGSMRSTRRILLVELIEADSIATITRRLYPGDLVQRVDFGSVLLRYRYVVQVERTFGM